MEGVYYLINNKFDESRLKIKQALKEYLNHDKAAHIGKAYSDIAYTFYLQSTYDSAIIFNIRAIPLLEKALSLGDLVTNYNNLALNYQNTGKMNEATETYFKGLNLADEFDFKEDRIIILYNLGNCYYSLDAKDKAIENFKLCQLLAINDKDTLSIIYSSNAIGSLAAENKQLDTASKYLNLSYKLSKIAGDSYTLMFGANGLASLEIENNNLKEAQSFLDKSYKYAAKMNNPDDLININIVQAELYSKQKKHTKAIKLLLKTYENAKIINSLETARYVLASLADVYEKAGDFSNALIYSKREKQYQDSINSSSILEKLVTLENKFEQEKIDKIKALELENSELERVAELRKANFTTIIFIISTATLLIISWLLFKLSQNRKKTQTQLLQSEKMASLGELTAGIAHEIQNPLNFVNNFSQVNSELLDELQIERKKDIRDFENEDEIFKDIKDNGLKIAHHGKRADVIVKGMLQHSRSSSDVKEATDINALADEYLRLSYHGLRAKDKSFNADFKEDFDKDLPKVNVIARDIGRVILNLINNAFYAVDKKKKKSTEEYKPFVSVSTRKMDDRIEIHVQDNGEGIPENIKEKIFQPFFTTKPSGEGTGLGLSISYEIVTKVHGGKLIVNSKENEGTTFIIYLPLKTNKQ